MNKNLKAMVMAAGMGSRLEPYNFNVSKTINPGNEQTFDGYYFITAAYYWV